MSVARLLFLAAISLTAVGCTSTRYNTESMQLAGERLYRTMCASCHGIGGVGDGPVADSLNARPANLTLIAQRHEGSFPDYEIKQAIDGRVDVRAHGSRTMPVWGQQFYFSADPNDAMARAEADARIRWIIEYLKTLQRT